MVSVYKTVSRNELFSVVVLGTKRSLVNHWLLPETAWRTCYVDYRAVVTVVWYRGSGYSDVVVVLRYCAHRPGYSAHTGTLPGQHCHHRVPLVRHWVTPGTTSPSLGHTGYNTGSDTGYTTGSDTGYNTGSDAGYNTGSDTGYSTGTPTRHRNTKFSKIQ